MATSGVSPRLLPEWTIEPRRSGLGARLGEVWRYRRLIRFFAYRAFQKLYARTKLGWLWLLIRPLFPLAIQTVVFSGVLAVGSDGLPYFLFLVVGSSFWQLFASAANWTTRSLQLNRGMITRMYVPRLILPIALVAPALVTFGIYACVALGAAVYYWLTQGIWYLHGGVGLFWVAVCVVLGLLLAIGIGLWTSVPALEARDVRFTLAYVLGFWQVLTPVLYPFSAVPAKWRTLMLLNPMTGLVETFKWGLLGTGTLSLQALAISLVGVSLVLGSGLWFFGRAEAEAADKA